MSEQKRTAEEIGKDINDLLAKYGPGELPAKAARELKRLRADLKEAES